VSLNRGTPFDDLLQALTEKMGVLHTAKPDTDPSQRDRVEWRNADSTYEPCPYTIPGTVTIGRNAVEYQVAVYGATELEVLQRVADLAGWLDNLVGPPQGAPPPAGNGYKIGKSSKPTQGGDGVSAGFGCTVPVTLFLPVFSEVRAELTVGHPGVSAIAKGSDDGPTNDGTISWQG
jgi:hypothetical protein